MNRVEKRKGWGSPQAAHGSICDGYQSTGDATEKRSQVGTLISDDDG